MSTISQTPTLAPAGSASQVSPDTAPTEKPRRGKGRRPAQSQVDKAAPPGAVEVPAGGQNKTKKTSPVVSGTIPLSGWGETDLSSHRRDILPKFTVDASPYFDLVDYTYVNMYGGFSSASKHIPFSLFRYYCMLLWWHRVLFLCKQNAIVLTKEEKDTLNVLSSGEEFQVPAPIAQYLANMGNFISGGETFYFEKLSGQFTGTWTSEGSTVEKGWLSTDTGIVVDSSESFWRYAQIPVPAVFALHVQHEVAHVTGSALPNLDHIAPTLADYEVKPTRNILGWYLQSVDATHSSWRSTYALLGWSATEIPTDSQTVFNISTSTMKWVSERIAGVKGLKVHGSKQLVLSNQGNPIQSQFLWGDYLDRTGWWNDKRFIDSKKGSLNTEFSLGSRYGMDDKLLSPSFSFGYRLNRFKEFHSTKNGSHTFYGQSRFDPWLYYKSTSNARQNIPVGWHNRMNDSYDYGSATVQLNTARFSTHGLVRSTGLDAAVALVHV